MAGDSSKKSKIKESDLTRLKYFDQLSPLLARLHEDGCQRDTASNRYFHYDQYCMLLLLHMFTPIVTSMRGIQQASELKSSKESSPNPRDPLLTVHKQRTILAQRIFSIALGYERLNDQQTMRSDAALQVAAGVTPAEDEPRVDADAFFPARV